MQRHYLSRHLHCLLGLNDCQLQLRLQPRKPIKVKAKLKPKFVSLVHYLWTKVLIFIIHRLTYGLDYEGNVCGSSHRHRDLTQLELRYWLNPNQVYESGLKDGETTLANARTICLLDCPEPSDDTLSWVCDYPDGEIRLKMDDWIDRNYDYFEFLTPEMRNSSLQLQGPCYPLIFPSVNGKESLFVLFL